MSARWSDGIDEGPLKALGMKALFGANYFSGGKVVILRLDLGAYDEVFTNDIPGFFDKLKEALPSLHEHHCSVGCAGGFFQRVTRGTLLGHVTEHVAIELQGLAGMDVAYGKTRATAVQGVYNVVFRFVDVEAGLFAGKAALNLVNALLAGRPFDVGGAVDAIVAIREQRLLGPSTQAIVAAAGRRGIPFLRLDEHNLVQLGNGRFKKCIRATVTEDTSLVAVETAGNRYLTARVLKGAGVPVPETIRAVSAEEVRAFGESLGQGGSLAIRPVTGNLGRGVTLDLSADGNLEEALAAALAGSDAVAVQHHVAGSLFRLLVIDNRFVAAVRVELPSVTGDGASTIGQLIAALNADAQRGVGDKTPLTRVVVDSRLTEFLAAAGLSVDSVLPAGRRFDLTLSRSLKLGASSEDVTDAVHPANRLLAERASRAVGLDAAGIDIVASAIETPLLETGGRVVDVAAAPDFRMHLTPARGEGRDVAEPFVDMLFPPPSQARVPLIAVTGTTGRGVAVRILERCLALAGRTVGLACEEGLFVGGELLVEGDATGLEGAAVVLGDRSIDCALLEVPLEGILESGLGYEFADCGVVLNVIDDGRRFDELETVEDAAYAHSVVAEQVYDAGYAVLNGDSDHVFGMGERLYSKSVLFSRSDDSPRVLKHVEAGGRAVVVDGGRVVIRDGRERIDLLGLDDLPLIGKNAQVECVLACVATLYCCGVLVDTIREGLLSFCEVGN